MFRREDKHLKSRPLPAQGGLLSDILVPTLHLLNLFLLVSLKIHIPIISKSLDEIHETFFTELLISTDLHIIFSYFDDIIVFYLT